MDQVYLDHAATTPLDPDVRAALQPFLEAEYGNPSSRHPLGVRAARALEHARRQVARALGARPDGVVFTSGATEANNLAVFGLARALAQHGRHVWIGPSEHASVRAAALALRAEGFEVELGRLTPDGALDLEQLERALRKDTVLVAQMLVSNELGTLYPLRAVSARVRARSPHARLHVDAVQALGKVDVTLAELGADSIALSGHKLHGPKGSGALVLAEGVAPLPLLVGGGQERGLRGGTENVPAQVGLGLAVELADRRRDAAVAAAGAARAVLAEGLARLSGVRLLEPGGRAHPRVDAIATLLLDGPPAEVWQHHLEARGVYVGTSSACQSNTKEQSPALLALGLDPERARRVLRLSFSRHTSTSDVRRALDALAQVERELAALER